MEMVYFELIHYSLVAIYNYFAYQQEESHQTLKILKIQTHF